MKFCRILYRTLTALALLTAIVSCKGNSTTDVTTPSSEVSEAAIAAAGHLVATDHSDTLALQRAILDAKAISGKWLMKGDTASVNTFDKAFADYLKQQDTELYNAIFAQ